MKRLLATGMISAIVLALAPVAQAGPVSVCAYVHISVNGEDVVNERQCQAALDATVNLSSDS